MAGRAQWHELCYVVGRSGTEIRKANDEDGGGGYARDNAQRIIMQSMFNGDGRTSAGLNSKDCES